MEIVEKERLPNDIISAESKALVRVKSAWIGNLSEFVFIRGSFMTQEAGEPVREMSNRWFESRYLFNWLHTGFQGSWLGKAD